MVFSRIEGNIIVTVDGELVWRAISAPEQFAE
jgi:hypothetical protein